MIFESLQLIAGELNKFLDFLSGQNDDLVMLGNIYHLKSHLPGNIDGSVPLNKIVLTLINVEENTLKKYTK